MVMHASKLPRLSDGFHDRNEAHPYQTSVDKYPSKSLNAGGTNSEHGTSKDRDREKSQLHPTQHREMPASGMRHSASPSTGSSRPGSESGSPRTYRNKSSYLQRQRDRQQRGSSTSPAENTFNNQAHHGSNSHSGDAKNSHEQHIKTILAKANEWTEHISSSGKKYYYNCKTEVSQWEKPKEWIERERLKRVVNSNASEKIPAKDSPKPVHAVDSRQAKSSNEKHSSDSNRDRPTSHQSQTQHSSDRHSHDSSYSVSSRRQEEYYSGSRQHEKSSSNTSSSSSKPSTTTSSSSSSSSTSGSNNNSGGHGHSSRSTPSRSTPSSTSTPTQSPYGRSQHHQQQLYHQTDGGAREHRNRTEHKGHEVLKSPSSGPSGGPSPSPGPSPGPGVAGLQMGGSSLSLATDMYGRLKSLVPQQQGSRSGEKLESPRVQGTPSPGPVTASPVTSKSHTSNQHSQSLHPPSAAQRLFSSSHSPSVDRNSATTTQQQAHSQQQGDRTDSAHDRLSNPSPMSIDSVSDLSSPAPSQNDPSPRPQLSTPVSQQTYSSQTQQTLTTATVSQAQNSVVTSVSAAGGTKQLPHVNQQKPSVDEDSRPPQASPSLSRKSVSPTHSVSSQSEQVTTPHKSPAAIAAALASAPLKPITATITPSLIQYYNESLTRHAQNWAADHAERQANRFNEESLTLGAEYSSQISVDLKFARSLVRASEIQATLQEQRILFLRQQAKDLEKLKSENAYMT